MSVTAGGVRSFSSGQAGAPSTRDYRFAPYAAGCSPRHHYVHSLADASSPAQHQLMAEVPSGDHGYLYRPVPPAADLWGAGERGQGAGSADADSSSLHLQGAAARQPFPLTLPDGTLDPHVPVSFLPQQFEQGPFSFSEFPQQSNAAFAPVSFPAQPDIPAFGFHDNTQSYHQGTSPDLHHHPVAQSYQDYPMGGGEFHPLAPASEERKPSLGHFQQPWPAEPGHHGPTGAGAGPEIDMADGDPPVHCPTHVRTDGPAATTSPDLPDPVGMAPTAPESEPQYTGPKSVDRGTSSEHDSTLGEESSSSESGVSPEPLYHSAAGPVPEPEPTSGSSTTPKKTPGSQKHRGSFDPLKRQQTAETRKIKACIRCRVQRKRCVSDPDGDSWVCKLCQAYSKESKKTIHHIACFRGKLTDVTLYRKGGLNLTRRWPGTELRDVPDRVNPADVRTIQFTQDLCKEPITVRVVQFRPREGDVTAKLWTVREHNQEVRKKRELPPFCLADVHAAAAEFKQYVERNAMDAWFLKTMPPATRAGYNYPPALRGVIERTYEMAADHFFALKNQHGQGEGPASRELQLMGSMFHFWFTIRHTTGTSWICGEDTLGIKAETKNQLCPGYNKVSMPRMIRAQFDSINDARLTIYFKEMIRHLEYLYMQNQPRWWLTLYLCTFVLLREASFMSEDRYRHARENYGSKIRYSIPSFVEKLQDSCNNILCHWHYYNCNSWPDPDRPWQRHRSLSAALSPEQYELVMETMRDPRVQRHLEFWARYKEQNGPDEADTSPRTDESGPEYPGSQNRFDWDHPLYWVSQMFEDKWAAHPTYQREYES